MESSAFCLENAELLLLEERLWVLTAPTGISNYDFRPGASFHCRRPEQAPGECLAVARIGAIPHYDLVYGSLQQEGMTLIHSPEEHLRVSELPRWYPLIADLTPKSIWPNERLTWREITSALGCPVFMKGTTQTSRHQRSLSIIETAEQYDRAILAYARDPILRHQGLVFREFVRLRLVEEPTPHRIPSAFEFRTFWWKGNLAGCGRYWWEGTTYGLTEGEAAAGLAVAGAAARRLKVAFLVIDIAQTLDGRWIVIECNEGQESGYGAISPVALWQRIIDLESSQ
jgi:hypothetical protein